MDFIDFLSENAVRTVLITESKQDIINLGFPEMIATYIQAKFGKFATIVAKWYKGYYTNGKEAAPNWFSNTITGYYSRGGIGVNEYIALYDAAKVSEQEYNKVRQKLGLAMDEDDIFDKKEIMDTFREEAYKELVQEVFFRTDLIKDISNGKIKDLKPYKDLSFNDAKEKYDEKRVFSDVTPLKVYPNGYKWINVGPKCELVGRLLNNCGSTGVMSGDKDRTMYTLFDANNKPHALATYSPNEHRLSGAEGNSSSPPKEEYHEYILDLAKTLGAKFDYDKSKSKSLKVKGFFGDNLKSIQSLPTESSYTELFKVITNDGKTYYTDAYSTVTPEELATAGKKETIDDLKDVFNNKRDYPNLEYGWIQ